MACIRPELASHGDCAIVIPISDHTTTSASKAMVPKNLRVRIVMADMGSSQANCAPCAREGADYKGRVNSIKHGSRRGFYDRYFRTAGSAKPRRQVVAGVGRRPDRDHGAGRRRDAADGIRIVDRRVETGHRYAAAAHGRTVDAGV